MLRNTLLLLLGVMLLTVNSLAQFAPGRYLLTPVEKQELATKIAKLHADFVDLEKSDAKLTAPLSDAEVFLSAVELNFDQSQFFTQQNVTQAKSLLTEAENRIQQLKQNSVKWTTKTGIVTLGYRSAIDSSYQPYQLYIPANYDFKSTVPQKVEIFLHGRMGNMSEIGFMSSKGTVGSAFGPNLPDHLVLFPFGRGNNGWRYGGEQDVFESLADVFRRFPVDANKIILRGFSMGGHGTWHIALQHPGMWAAASPGAGFVDTINYQNMDGKMPAWQLSLLSMYDPIRYSVNASNFPLRPYVGETDTFATQHKLMTTELDRLKIPYKQFVGPATGHKYESKTLVELLNSMDNTVRRYDSSVVDFVTYTLAWPSCKWVSIDALYHHWERAEVHARVVNPTHLAVFTQNIWALHITPPVGDEHSGTSYLTIDMDGGAKNGATTIIVKNYKSGRPIYLVRRNKHWQPARFPELLHKKPGLQGPIDDALFSPLIAIKPTGTPWNNKMASWTGKELDRFQTAWSSYFRATLPIIPDTGAIPDALKGRNLYLFGDPGSNSVLKDIVGRLPLVWKKDYITIAGKNYPTDKFLPMMIFPNPDDPDHYVVINTGMTFSLADIDGSNSLQYPHLPDFAIIRYDANQFSDDRKKDTVLAGFFDEFWKMPVNVWTNDLP